MKDKLGEQLVSDGLSDEELEQRVRELRDNPRLYSAIEALCARADYRALVVLRSPTSSDFDVQEAVNCLRHNMRFRFLFNAIDNG